MTVYIASYRELFALVAARPRMYLPRDDFATVVAYVEGCDQGNARALLAGFREWLITRAGCGDNLVWWALVQKLAQPESADGAENLTPDNDIAAKQTLFRLLDEFLELRDEHDGLQRIYAAYQQWRTARADDGCAASGQPGCPVALWPRPRSRTESHR
ncbi:hypothetical protein ACFOOK_03435 [Micromonospora krabiensis]|uniref:Uncharacterized protein n=1 Tax=Micromonospora krabiensis TaxID=307121 RepID=A0A1C3MW93_9ACTN|nr:hypothetical protein [Micromonospora krabiensis]SBV24596.1 hypothetical protein GA0070620_0017 [Micromonospora krabiensis]